MINYLQLCALLGRDHRHQAAAEQPLGDLDVLLLAAEDLLHMVDGRHAE